MWIYLSLLVALIGVLMYALSVNPKLQEIGRICFGCGLLAFLLASAGPLVSLLKG
jgi:Na+/phosphate symporter